MNNLVQFILFIVGINLAIILSPVLIPGYVIYRIISDGDDGERESGVDGPQTWESYDDFLQSEVWEEKRKAVMDRAEGICEKDGCDNPAVEVHHETYEYGLGNTPNHLLRALCGRCHDAEHTEKSQRYIAPEAAAVDGSQTWESYDEFLQSEVWKEKRKAVMDRAEGICEKDGCDNPAVEVHHETYEYGLGNTPNNLLRALCGRCHDAEHPEKPQRYMSPEEASRALKELGSKGEKKGGS